MKIKLTTILFATVFMIAGGYVKTAHDNYVENRIDDTRVLQQAGFIPEFIDDNRYALIN